MSDMKPRNWFDAVQHCQQTGAGYVLITVLSTAGSAPRDAGTKMVVTDAQTIDTIGGGHLEHAATQQARELLLDATKQQANLQHIENYKFDSGLGQCCGGAAHVLFECFIAHGEHIAIFGAGHVAKALVPILAQLPLQIHWIDNRESMFADVHDSLPANVHCTPTDDPVYELRQLPPQCRILIMTHNHQIDFDLVFKALTKHSFPFVGMIGSDTKARRFKQRLAHRNVAENVIARLVSPVGDLSIPGKRPIEVAVSVAAQIIRQINEGVNTGFNTAPNAKPAKQTSLQQTQWQQSKQLSALLEDQSGQNEKNQANQSG